MMLFCSVAAFRMLLHTYVSYLTSFSASKDIRVLHRVQTAVSLWMRGGTEVSSYGDSREAKGPCCLADKWFEINYLMHAASPRPITANSTHIPLKIHSI